MNTVITTGYYATKLNIDNFKSGLYVINVDKEIFITSIISLWKTNQPQYLIINLNTGDLFSIEDYIRLEGKSLFIIEDDSLIKIQVKVNN